MSDEVGTVPFTELQHHQQQQQLLRWSRVFIASGAQKHKPAQHTMMKLLFQAPIVLRTLLVLVFCHRRLMNVEALSPYNLRSTVSLSSSSMVHTHCFLVHHNPTTLRLVHRGTSVLHVSSIQDPFATEEHNDDDSVEVAVNSSPPTLGPSFSITTTILFLAGIWYLFATQQQPQLQQFHHHHHPFTLATTLRPATTPSTMMSSFCNFGQLAWTSYQRVLSSNPVATKSATSAFVYALGDMIAQSSESKNPDEQAEQQLDMLRTFKSLLAGGIGHGPLSHVWYNLSESFFQHWHLTAAAAATATSWGLVVPKIVADQAIWGPIWTSLYLIMLGIMNGQGPKAIQQTIYTSLLPLTVRGLGLWPAAHVITYGLVPVQDRLLWVDLVEIIWVTILATQAEASLQQQQHQQQQPLDGGGDEESSTLPVAKATTITSR
jgi:protein Mpv17